MNPATDTLTENLALPWKQQRVNVLPGVTARGMASLIDSFDRGYLRQFALAAEEMIERDETLIVAVPKMKRRVASRPWDVLIGEEVPDELQKTAEEHQAVLKHAYSNMRCENAVEKNETGGMKLLIRRMMSAPLNRFAVSRLIWRPSAEGLTFTARFCPLSLFDNTTGELRWAGVQGNTPGQAITDPENWLIAVSDTCLMKALAICYIFKRLPMQDALNFCQRFGINAVHGMTDAKPGSDEWSRFVTALRSFANDLSIATSKGSEIKVLENTAANGEQVFGWIIEMMKRAMVTICCGSDLATMSRENGTGASLQSEDADEMTADYCEFISETFNEQIDRRIIEDRFGEGAKPLAFFKLIPPQNDDAELEMKIDDHVTKHGVKLSREDVAERFNRSHDEDAEGGAGTPARKPAEKSLRAPLDANAAAANEATRQLAALDLKRRAAFILATRQDVKPVADALKALNEAQGAQATRDAFHSLSLSLPGVEDAVIDGDAANAALEVAMATELLRGLQSLGEADDAESANAKERWVKGSIPYQKKGPSPGRFRAVSSISDVLRDEADPAKTDSEAAFKVEYSNFVRSALAKITGMDVSKITHSIDTQGVRHIRKAHKKNEITDQDFERIADVVGNAERVYGSKTNSGEAGVEFWKKDGSWMLVVETIHKPHHLRVHNFKRMKEIRREEAAPPA